MTIRLRRWTVLARVAAPTQDRNGFRCRRSRRMHRRRRPSIRRLASPARNGRYRDASGAVLGYALRFDAADNSKQFRPLTFWRSAAGGKAEWRWESWPPKRPLYGLERLAERPSTPVVVCEGEKAADAATRLLPSFVAVTSPNGSKSAGKADWSPLKGRAVTVWPDADAAGLEYARQVAKLATAAGARTVAIVSPPADVKVGWDAADALAEGWTPERAAELIAAAVPAEQIASNKTSGRRARRNIGARRGARRPAPHAATRRTDRPHRICRTLARRRTAPPMPVSPVNDHRENWPVRSRDFRMWLSGRFFEETGGAIGGQALEDGLRILEARAVNEGPQYECFNRTGAADGKLYLGPGRCGLARGRNYRDRVECGRCGRRSNCCARHRCARCRSPKLAV